MKQAIEAIKREADSVWEMAKHASGFQGIQLAAIFAGLSRAATILSEEIKKQA